MYCDIFLVCINTQVNLDSFLSLDHAVLSNTGEYLGHGGGGGGVLTENNEGHVQNSPLLLGPLEILLWGFDPPLQIIRGQPFDC